jgi:ATP-dependent helicase/nuclease subunit B
VMIWGTLEARVQGADLVILGGLNEGVWPATPAPDPWLSREMRLQAGLLLPERRIGLSAHDFQQAIGADQVVLSRAIRDAESETVVSRWINRLTNLMQGMSDQGAHELTAMRARGNVWLEMAHALERPDAEIAPEPRPSPQPPAAARPRKLSVTAITRLIRDPYAIYAEKILRLRKLDPLRRSPDAALRGTVLHDILRHLIGQNPHPISAETMLQVADEFLQANAPWPTARIIWRAKLARITDGFLRDEAIRQAMAQPVALEQPGSLLIDEHAFYLTGKVDRIDRAADGTLIIYDYKTGTLPSKLQIKHFDKQLYLEALMAEGGAFEKVAPATVQAVAHIGLGSDTNFRLITLDPDETAAAYDEFLTLLGEYANPLRGYTSRRAMAKVRFAGDYDHLARFGEWDASDEPVGVIVGS